MARTEERVELTYHDNRFSARRLAGGSGLRLVIAFITRDPDRYRFTINPSPGSGAASQTLVDRDARGNISSYSEAFDIASNAGRVFKFWREYMLKNGWEEVSAGEQRCEMRLKGK